MEKCLLKLERYHTTKSTKVHISTNKAWGDLDDASTMLEITYCKVLNRNAMISNDILLNENKFYEQYNIDIDIQHFQHLKKIKKSFNRPYYIVKQPHILDNISFFDMRRKLNKEQAAIAKDILTKKKKAPNELIHLFLTGGAGTGKTFTAIAIFQSLVRMYNSRIEYDPLKLKGIIRAYIGKEAFNAGGVTLHSAFYMPFNKAEYLPLSNEKLDTITKHYEQLRVVLIDEASLVGSTFLYQIDKRLREIKHSPTTYFGNVNMIFCGDLYQAQPVKDSLIFETPILNKQKSSYNFWQEKVKCYELHMPMHQKDENFIRILNKMRLNE